MQEGQEVKVKVIGVDDAGRINLSIKKAMEPPAHQGRPAAPRPVGFTGQKKAPEPVTFEDKLKQFMASSGTKLSEHHLNEKKASRRGGGGRR